MRRLTAGELAQLRTHAAALDAMLGIVERVSETQLAELESLDPTDRELERAIDKALEGLGFLSSRAELALQEEEELALGPPPLALGARRARVRTQED